MDNKKNFIIKAENADSEQLLTKILKMGKGGKLFVNFETPIDEKIIKKNDDDYFISVKNTKTKLKNQKFYQLPVSLQQISLMISNKLITGDYDYLILNSFEYLLTFHKFHILENFLRFLIRSSNNMDIHVIGVYEDNEQSSKLIPSLRKYF